MKHLITKQYDPKKVFADGPTLVGVVAGIRFYEHPRRGDEVPLIAYHKPSGLMGLSVFWEVPALEEIADAVAA